MTEDVPELTIAACAIPHLEPADRPAVRHLLKHGPSPYDDLQNYEVMTPEQRLYGFTEFKVEPVSNTANDLQAKTGRGGPTAVYYLYYDHDPEDVIRAFCEANPRLMEHICQQGATVVFGRHGPEWADAARTVISKEYNLPNPHGKPTGAAAEGNDADV